MTTQTDADRATTQKAINITALIVVGCIAVGTLLSFASSKNTEPAQEAAVPVEAVPASPPPPTAQEVAQAWSSFSQTALKRLNYSDSLAAAAVAAVRINRNPVDIAQAMKDGHDGHFITDRLLIPQAIRQDPDALEIEDKIATVIGVRFAAFGRGMDYMSAGGTPMDVVEMRDRLARAKKHSADAHALIAKHMQAF